MQKRHVAVRTFRWVLLAACLLIAFALFRVFWWDASRGRAAREADRIESVNDPATLPGNTQPPPR